MRKIRHSIFETNSSSTHSISIVKGKLQFPKVGKEVTITGKEFGWEYARYHDWETKADYLATYLFQNRICLESEKTRLTIEEYDDRLKQWNMDREDLYLVLEEGLDAKVIIPLLNLNDYVNIDNSFKRPYIDHQSSDVASDAFADLDAIRNFIFCEDSVLETDNDNR